MKIVKKELPSNGDADNFTTLSENQIQIRIHENKIACCMSKDRHATMRYRLSGKEYYISFFPGKFNTWQDDYTRYLNPTPTQGTVDSTDQTHTSSSELPAREKYKTTSYTLTLSTVGRMHEKLFPPPSPQASQPIVSDGSGATTTEQIPQLIIPQVQLKFNLCATVCCRSSYNCTSLVINLLDDAGVQTDMSVSYQFLFAFSLFFLATSVGYCSGEAAQLSHYLNNQTGYDENLADEVMAVVDLIIVLAFLVLGLASQFKCVNSKCIKKCAEEHYCDKNPLTYATKVLATQAAVSTVLSIIALIIHCIHTPFNFQGSSDEIQGAAWGAAAGLLLLVISSIITLACDCKGGVTNPYGLKRLLDLHAVKENNGSQESPDNQENLSTALINPLADTP